MKKIFLILGLIILTGITLYANNNPLMKKFDPNYKIVEVMYDDEYYPKECVNKVKALIDTLVLYLETGEKDSNKIQIQLDKMTIGINNLQDDFYKNDSEIETGARESIGATVVYILEWFDINIDIETAISQRDW